MMRLLWIDDDVQGIADLRPWLGADIKLTIAADVATGLYRLGAETFDLVIVDGLLDRGILTDPHLSALVPDDPTPAGLHLTGAMRAEGGLNLPATPFLLCTSFDESHLRADYPELMTGVPYLSKSALLRDLKGLRPLLLGLARGEAPPTQVAPTPSKDRERDYERRWHDLRNGAGGCVAPLSLLSERLLSMAGVDAFSMPLLDAEISRFAAAAKEVIEELDDDPQARRKAAYATLDEAFTQLQRTLADPRPAKLSMSIGLVERIGKALERFPNKSRHRASLEASLRQVRMLVSVLEVQQISHRIESVIRDTDPRLELTSALPFDASAIVNDLVAQNWMSAARRRLEIRPSITPGVMINHGSSAAYSRLIRNIIENGIKYNEQLWDSDAWVKVTLEPIEGRCVACVENWGLPIPEAEFDAVIQGGVRGSNARQPGMGLGLAFVRETAAEFGGSVDFKTILHRSGKAQIQVLVSIPLGAV